MCAVAVPRPGRWQVWAAVGFGKCLSFPGTEDGGGTLAADGADRQSDRHVLPVDRPTVLDQSGFLDASMAGAWWLGPADRPRPAADLAGQPGSFVLLAAGGAGKSTVLRGLRCREAGAVEVDLVVLDRTGMGRELRDAIAAGGPVYLDALDEAALHEPVVFRVLEHHLTSIDAAGVPWRLACRPAAWNPALAAALTSSLPAFEQLKLLPLTRQAAADLAAGAGADPAGFLDALISAGLGRLAASPMRLRAAAIQWNLDGRLPASQLEAIRFEVDQLLTETDAGRPLALLADRRRRIAARLAAMTVFGKASRFTRAADPAPNALRVPDLPSTPEPDEPGTPINVAQYEEVLGTALFEAASGTGVSFRHQRYAEFLAATYLHERRIPRPQLRALLGVGPDGTLPGITAGIAAWAGALDPELTDDIVAANGPAFAEAGVELPSHHLRSVVVGGVLERAATGDIGTQPGLDLSPLAYPGLEAQLTGYLGPGLSQPQQLWWIARLATIGHCRGMASALLDAVLAWTGPAWARRAGVAAVAALGTDDDLRKLQQLARLDPADDPGDDILAAVIEALYPRLLDTAGLLEILRPHRDPNYLGPYDSLLAELSGQVPASDLPTVLTWAAEHVQDGENAYGALLPQLVQHGWAHTRSPDAAGALARLVSSLASDSGWPHWPGPHEIPWANADPGERRDLAVGVAGNIPPEESYRLIALGLLARDDLRWLVSGLPALPPPAREALAWCVSPLTLEPTAVEADLILGMPADHPAYPHTQWLRQPVPINSDSAQLWRRHQQDELEAERVQSAGRQERQLQLAAALGDARADPGCWWRVAVWLAAGDSGHDNGMIFSHDLTARPGWPLLDRKEREDVLALGIQYVNIHQVQPAAWIGRPKVPVALAAADWSGIYLLTTLATHSPQRLAAVTQPAWRSWAPAIVGAWDSGTGGGQRARCQLAGLVPAGEKQAVLDAALRRLDALQEHGGRLSPRELYDHLTPRLAPELAGHLLDGRYTGQLADDVLSMLVDHAPQAARGVCRQLLARREPALAAGARRGLARLDPAIVIHDLVSTAAAPADIADIAPHLDLSRLGDLDLAGLGRLLLQCVPFGSDPQGAYGTVRGFQVRSVRGTVMQLLADHGQVRFFEELAQQHSGGRGQETIAWYLRQARDRAADLGYTGLQPAQLLQLLSRTDAHLVRHDGDLLEVVLSQLDDLQHDLTHKGTSRFLWNLGPGTSTPKSEDDISDWVSRELRLRLTPATMIDREVQVTRGLQGIGTRIDLTATTPTATQPPTSARVIAEAKLVTNSTLLTAMEEQLVQRYLIPAGLQYGIYLIYWIDPRQRPTGSRARSADRDALVQQLNEQAAKAGDGLQIRPYLLDISHP